MKLRLTLLLIFLALLSGCIGGSGSSGFDISPAAESRNIDEALAEQRCVQEGELTICPADRPFQSIPGVPPDTLPSNEGSGLGIAREHTDITGCSSEICTVVVQPVPLGLPATAIYQLAVRSSVSSEWSVGGSVTGAELAAGRALSATISAEVASQPLQLAVLVYLEADPTTQGMLETLYQSGAELVFVGAVVSF